MGRPRKDGNPLKLEKRVYPHRGQFIYRHRDGSTEWLGKDVEKANAQARIYNDPEGRFGTLGHFLDLFIADAKAGRLHKKKAARTVEDYEECAPYLKLIFEKAPPLELAQRPSLIADYRDNRSIAAPVRANRELSLLSVCYSWMIEKGLVPGLTANPVASIARNSERPKDRYVEDGEYLPVYGIAQRSVCMAMTLAYRTLQRPEDLLRLEPGAVRTRTIAGKVERVLPVTQGKTGRTVNIEVTPELDEALGMLAGGRVAKFSSFLIHDLRGQSYTVEGIGAMLRRCCYAAKVPTFGLMDVRAKGATDLYLTGTPLEQIQLLMGHASVTTTEVYIKRLIATIRTSRPNPIRIAAGGE